MSIELKIRDINTGKTQLKVFERVEDARDWLKKRPRFTEVLGLASQTYVSASVEALLRESLRPLDEEERAAKCARDEAHEEALRRELVHEQRRAEAEVEARREALKKADPDRPMTVEWERGKGIWIVDEADEREIPEVVQQAVAKWVAERDKWVHPKRQYVASAVLTVWPGPIPGGNEANRIHPGGEFYPVAGIPPEEREE